MFHIFVIFPLEDFFPVLLSLTRKSKIYLILSPSHPRAKQNRFAWFSNIWIKQSFWQRRGSLHQQLSKITLTDLPYLKSNNYSLELDWLKSDFYLWTFLVKDAVVPPAQKPFGYLKRFYNLHFWHLFTFLHFENRTINLILFWLRA